MMPPEREESRTIDRHHFVLGAFAVLFVAVFLARFHVFTIDHDYPAAHGEDGKPAPKDGLRLDINSADAAELSLLPDIGPERARAIVEFRSKWGRFRTVTELLRVDGIGPDTLERMLPHISIQKD